jgi:hypothetical protein
MWDSVKKRPLRCKPDSFELYSNLFNIENPAMVEVLCTFLTSNLVENNLSPHFPLFYGTVNCQFKNFTFPERASKELNASRPLFPKKYRIVTEGNSKRIQVNNCPVQMLFTEMIGEETLGDVVDRENFQSNRWRSYCFQVIAALSIIQSRYKMYHNDLHINNLICQKTKKQFLYYRCAKGRLYRVPTYGKIIKIIDWGRGTLKYKYDSIRNKCFNLDGDVFGQFYPPTSLHHKRRTVNYNNSIDMVMFAFTMLESFYLNSSDYESSSNSTYLKANKPNKPEYIIQDIEVNRQKRLELLPKSDIVKFLFDICDNTRGKNFYTHCQKLNFTFYCEAAKYSKGACPLELVHHDVFKNYIVESTTDCEDNITVYPLE